jgi:hypothetical protein
MVTTWGELFQQCRDDGFPEVGLPAPIEYNRDYIMRLEQCIRRTWAVGESIPAVETLPYGLILGDVLVKQFRARWEYGPCTWPTMTGGQILSHHVVLGGVSSFPFVRIGKFVADPSKTLTSF